MTKNYQAIRHVVGLIPEGKVASYSQVADLAGLPGRARLVSRALKSAAGPPPLPWHRVVKADGRLALPLGSQEAEQQMQLLLTEGVIITNRRVPMNAFQWQPDLSVLLSELNY